MNKMMHRFMISVAAAALIAGTGLAHAQGTGMGHEGPSAGAGAEHGAPATGHGGSAATPMGHDAGRTMPSSGMKAEQSEPKSPAAARDQRAEENTPGQKSPGMSSEMNDNAKGGDRASKAEGREDRNGMKAENGADRGERKAEGREDRNGMKAENGEDRGERGAEGPEDRNGMKAENGEDRGERKAEGREDRNDVNGEHRSETVGQAGGGGKLSSEQRTRITTVIRDQHVRPIEHVNFAISVGTRVPHDVEFYPLPEQIVTIYPDWRGYEFFLVADQIVVVNPRTLEIVAVLEA